MINPVTLKNRLKRDKGIPCQWISKLFVFSEAVSVLESRTVVTRSWGGSGDGIREMFKVPTCNQ